jgi:hypothetical protein
MVALSASSRVGRSGSGASSTKAYAKAPERLAGLLLILTAIALITLKLSGHQL